MFHVAVNNRELPVTSTVPLSLYAAYRDAMVQWWYVGITPWASFSPPYSLGMRVTLKQLMSGLLPPVHGADRGVHRRLH